MTWNSLFVLDADLDGDIAGAFETVWSAYIWDANITRGRPDSLAAIEPTRLSLTLKNTDGRFSPDREILGNWEEGTGYTSPVGTNYKLASKCPLSHDTCISSIVWYGKAYSGTSNCKAVIYSDNAGAPDALKGTSAEVAVSTTLGWWTFTFASPVVLTAGDYWLGIHAESRIMAYKGTGSANQYARNADAYAGGPADPFGAVDEYAVYALYIYAPNLLDVGKRIRFYQTNPDTNYLFGGRISELSFKPSINEQAAYMEAVDLLGYAETIPIDTGLMDGRTADLVLHRILDLCEEGEIISNPGAEVDATNWGTVLGTETVTRDTVAPLEGEGCIKCVCPNTVGAGVKYDIYADGETAGAAYTGGFYINAPVGATLRVRGWTDYGGSIYQASVVTNITGTGAWQHVKPLLYTYSPVAAAQIRIETMTSAQAITFYVDDLHLAPYQNRIYRTFEVGQTALSRVAFSGESALEAIRKVVASEPGFLWCSPDVYGGTIVFKNKDYAPALELTFSDASDAANKYQGLDSHESIGDRIGLVEVAYGSAQTTETTATVIWRFTGCPITIVNGQTRYIGVSSSTASVENTVSVTPTQASCTAIIWRGTVKIGGAYWYRSIRLKNEAAPDWDITALSVNGKPVTVTEGEGEGVYEYEPAGAITKRTLSLDMPFVVATDAIVAATAATLGDKYVGRVFRGDLMVRPSTDAYLNTLFDLDLRDRVGVIDDNRDCSLGIDTECWVEGVDIHIVPGILVDLTYHLEEV